METSEKSGSSISKALGWIAVGAGLYMAGNSLYKEYKKYNFNGKVVLITGGSRGLGFVLAKELALKGAKLAICARSLEELVAAKTKLERITANKVLTIVADVTNRNEVTAMISAVTGHYRRLDMVINNAGIVQVGPIDAMRIEDFEEAMQTNFYAPLYTMLGVLPYFLEQGEGRIVNISSIGGKIAVPHLLPYTASKFALTGLSEGMHAELKKHNIHVTTVIPNLMRTGSPRNITVKGNHEAEYAWFKLADSFPLISQDVERAAKDIIKSVEYGQSETVLTAVAKIATVIQGVAPGSVNTILSFINRLLPNNAKQGHTSKKGYEAESHLSRNFITAITDKAALANNEAL